MATWIDAEDQHKRIVDAEKLDTIYVRYRSNGIYVVIGSIGDRDIALVTVGTAADAVAWVEDIKQKLN